MSLLRYVPERPFPAYAFIPGQAPHPRSHPDGHSYGAPEDVATQLEPQAWHSHQGYLWGVDLYNHSYPWEAHEAWEGPWRLAERGTTTRMYLQGLIQCSAAVVKARAGQAAGVASLAGSGIELLREVQDLVPTRYMGLDIAAFVTAFHAYASAYPHARDRFPRIVLV